MGLKNCYSKGIIEAGCDEAGRGCLAGPVVAAAVILPKGFKHKLLDDSKKMSEKDRFELEPIINKDTVCPQGSISGNRSFKLRFSLQFSHNS